MEEESFQPRKVTPGKRNRRAGHQYERDIAAKFRELGFHHAATSRRMSRVLDDAKIDIYGIPMNVQAKNVGTKINYEALFLEIKVAISKFAPKRSSLPTVIMHKRNGKSLVIMSESDFFEILKMFSEYGIEKLKDDV